MKMKRRNEFFNSPEPENYSCQGIKARIKTTNRSDTRITCHRFTANYRTDHPVWILSYSFVLTPSLHYLRINIYIPKVKFWKVRLDSKLSSRWLVLNSMGPIFRPILFFLYNRERRLHSRYTKSCDKEDAGSWGTCQEHISGLTDWLTRARRKTFWQQNRTRILIHRLHNKIFFFYKENRSFEFSSVCFKNKIYTSCYTPRQVFLL